MYCGKRLTQMTAPVGTLVEYATATGKTASDGSGVNGLYTQELLKAMKEPGLPIEEVFKRVRTAVRKRNRRIPRRHGKPRRWKAVSISLASRGSNRCPRLLPLVRLSR